MRNIPLLLLLFLLLYLEPINLAGIKFAVYWKALLFGCVILYGKFRKLDLIAVLLLALIIKPFFTTGVIRYGYVGDAISHSIRGFTLFIFYAVYIRVSLLDRLLYVLPRFVIASFIPFVFGLIEPIAGGYDLSIFENSDIDTGLVGVFQSPHYASIVLAISILIIYYNSRKKIDYVFFGFGFYCLLFTFVRLGVLMLFIGILFTVDWRRHGVKVIAGLVFFSIVAVTLLPSSTPVISRYTNSYSESSQKMDLNKLSSGRLFLSGVNLVSYSQGTLIDQAIGFGFEYSADRMEKMIGLRKVSHNGFVDALVHNGVIGFVILSFTLISFWRKYRGRHARALLVGFILVVFLQGGNFFLFELLLVLSLRKISLYETLGARR